MWLTFLHAAGLCWHEGNFFGPQDQRTSFFFLGINIFISEKKGSQAKTPSFNQQQWTQRVKVYPNPWLCEETNQHELLAQIVLRKHIFQLHVWSTSSHSKVRDPKWGVVIPSLWNIPRALKSLRYASCSSTPQEDLSLWIIETESLAISTLMEHKSLSVASQAVLLEKSQRLNGFSAWNLCTWNPKGFPLFWESKDKDI